ncbi:MAG: site-specific integrase [Actinobacteria bacterium]|nr:site-specific integrase [Actinomycetota bacterium]
MASAFIVPRATKSGKRFHARWQRGYHEPQIHLGSFKTRRAAETRCDWARNEWAAGRVPDRKTILLAAEQARTVRDVVDEYIASRVDARDSSRLVYRQRLQHAIDRFGDLDPNRVTPKMVRDWTLTMRGAPRSVRSRVSAFRQLLDYVGVNPNPTRDATIKMPRHERSDPPLPGRAQIETILEEVAAHHRAPIWLMVTTGMRVSEVVALTWGDIDQTQGRLRVADSKTRAGRRWVSVDDMPLILRPRGMHASRRVFGQTADAIRSAISRVCTKHGWPSFSPHKYRHLHASRLMHDRDLSPAEVAARIGHSNVATTLGTYVQLVPPD